MITPSGSLYDTWQKYIKQTVNKKWYLDIFCDQLNTSTNIRPC